VVVRGGAGCVGRDCVARIERIAQQDNGGRTIFAVWRPDEQVAPAADGVVR